MPVAGIDVGSVAAKAVVLDEEKKIVLGRAVLPTGWNSREAGEQVMQAACRAAGVETAALRRVVGTGYGRVALPFADKVVTEISCHARGASWLFPATGVVLDIGGQDSKVIAVEDGAVQDFVMNDKCAAGTGRFLQVVSGILGMELPELGLAAAAGKLDALSPLKVLSRGYSIVYTRQEDGAGRVASRTADIPPGARLTLRLSDGTVDCTADPSPEK